MSNQVGQPATVAVAISAAATTAAPNTQTSTNVRHPKPLNARQSSAANHTANTIAQSNAGKVVVITNKII